MFVLQLVACKTRISAVTLAKETAMCPAEKHAWFNLAVMALTVVAVGLLFPFFRMPRALGGLGLLGFMGFGVFFYRRRRGHVAMDERDTTIQRCSIAVASATFWIVFVLAIVSAPLLYGESGSVPMTVIQNALWMAFMLIYAVSSIAT